MSTLQHIIDISGPMLGGFAAGQRQLALRQQAEQAAIDDAMRQQAFAAHIQQQGIQNQHWDQGFQLDQQQFQQRSAQDDIRNNQWQQGFGLDQQNAAMRSHSAWRRAAWSAGACSRLRRSTRAQLLASWRIQPFTLVSRV